MARPDPDDLDLLDELDTSAPRLTKPGPRPIGADRPIDIQRPPRLEPVSAACPGAKGKPCGKRLRSDSPPPGADGKRRCGACSQREALHPCPGCHRDHTGPQPYCRRCRPDVPRPKPATRATLAHVRPDEPRAAPGPTPPPTTATLPDVTALPIEYLATCVHELRRRIGSLLDSLKE